MYHSITPPLCRQPYHFIHLCSCYGVDCSQSTRRTRKTTEVDLRDRLQRKKMNKERRPSNSVCSKVFPFIYFHDLCVQYKVSTDFNHNLTNSLGQNG